MSDSKKQLQEALVEGATTGLNGKDLLQFVKQKTKAKDKKIVSAAFFALTDPDLKDRKVLDSLYSFGLSYRFPEEAEAADVAAPAEAATPAEASEPLAEKVKKKRARAKKD